MHAECTIAVYLTTLDRGWEHIGIGCSTCSCLVCEMYLTQCGSILKLHVRNMHGKLQPDWTIPVCGDQTSKQCILGVLEVLHRTHNAMKSDSEPPWGSGSDKEKKVSAERPAKTAWFRL